MKRKITIFECYNETKKQLKAAGIEDYVFEAKQIVRYVTKYDTSQILVKYNEELDVIKWGLWEVIMKQRTSRYPLQYILGEWDFYGLHFKVGEGCLAPRADTEVLVDTAFDFIKEKPDSKVLDLCAGSGCIGITVAKRYPQTKVTLVEKYQKPAEFCKQNIELNGVENAQIMTADIFDYQPKESFDVILSNPPYISADEMSLLNEEAKREPESALYGGEDGLDFYRAILSRYPVFLNNGGMLAVEIGFSQAESVRELFKQAGFSDITVKKDLSGNDRVVFGTVNDI